MASRPGRPEHVSKLGEKVEETLKFSMERRDQGRGALEERK